VRVRITEKPREAELDGVKLDGYLRGMVRDVSPLIGAWLIMQGYAELEMRETADDNPGARYFTSARQGAAGRARRRPDRRRSQD
jgi:hypothetical protein